MYRSFLCHSDWFGNEGGSSYEGPPLTNPNGVAQKAVSPENPVMTAPVKLYMLSCPPVLHKTPMPPTFTLQLFLDFPFFRLNFLFLGSVLVIFLI